MAAHSLGYVGPVNQDELDAARKAGRTDLNLNAQIGRAGLEKTYDADLRGKDGVRYVTVDNRGTLIGTQRETEPERGDTLVTSIDRDVQRIAEQALTAEITKRRTERDKDGNLYAAPSGAAVVLDPRNGRVIAMASTPTTTRRCSSAASPRPSWPGSPTRNAARRCCPGRCRASSRRGRRSSCPHVGGGDVRPAPLSGTYSCPGSLEVGNTTKNNFEGRARRLHQPADRAGEVVRHDLLRLRADRLVLRPGPHRRRPEAGREPAADGARRTGSAIAAGSTCRRGEQTSGRIVDRSVKPTRWDANKATYCADAKRGYPEVTDAARRTFLTRLAAENCTDGWRFHAGDNGRPGHRAGRDDGDAAAAGGGLLGAGQRRHGLVADARPGRRRPGRQGGPRDQPDRAQRQVPVTPVTLSTTSRRRCIYRRSLGLGRGSRSAASRTRRGPGRRQDRYGRGVRQAGHLVVRVAGAPAGQAGRRFVVVAMIEQAGPARRPPRRSPGHLRGHLRLTGRRPAFPQRTAGRGPARDGQP